MIVNFSTILFKDFLHFKRDIVFGYLPQLRNGSCQWPEDVLYFPSSLDIVHQDVYAINDTEVTWSSTVHLNMELVFGYLPQLRNASCQLPEDVLCFLSSFDIVHQDVCAINDTEITWSSTVHLNMVLCSHCSER